jgi:hypothetical protein
MMSPLKPVLGAFLFLLAKLAEQTYPASLLHGWMSRELICPG